MRRSPIRTVLAAAAAAAVAVTLWSAAAAADSGEGQQTFAPPGPFCCTE